MKLKELREENNIKQIELANEHNLPIVIHNRDAMADTYQILKEHKVNKGGVMHCYSGSPEMAVELIKLGFYISMGGPVTFKNARVPKEVVAKIPLDHLLVETDCPYLAPHPLRGTMNEPKNVVYVVKEIAEIKGVSVSEVEEETYKNAKKIFNI